MLPCPGHRGAKWRCANAAVQVALCRTGPICSRELGCGPVRTTRQRARLRASGERTRRCHIPTPARPRRLIILHAEIGRDHLGMSGCPARASRSSRRSPSPRQVGNFHHHRHVVLDQQDRGGVVEDRSNSSLSAALSRALSPAAGCQTQQCRPVHSRARDFEPALVAIGQVAAHLGALEQPERRARAAPGRSRVSRRCARWRADQPEKLRPEASISALCCATIRFSSAVMPGNSRMFWKVRATFASLEIRKSFSRSSWMAAVKMRHPHRAQCRFVETGDAVEHRWFCRRR